jgi:hypothetical protein
MPVTAHIIHLNLSGKKLDAVMCHCLAAALGSATGLTHVDLGHNMICDDPNRQLGVQFSTVRRKNVHFDHHSEWTWQDEVCGRGTADCVTRPMSTAEWHQGHNSIGAKALLTALTKCTLLQKLVLADNHLGVECIEALSSFIVACKALSVLDISNCHLGMFGNFKYTGEVKEGLGKGGLKSYDADPDDEVAVAKTKRALRNTVRRECQGKGVVEMAAPTLLAALAKNASVREVRFDGNCFHPRSEHILRQQTTLWQCERSL